jgi:CheY-like chemotaxis protein
VIANLDMAVQDVNEMQTRGLDLPPDLIDELTDARDASERVRLIVRDLKIFSLTEVDKRGPVDVEHVLDSTLRMAWNEIRHRARVVKNYGQVPNVEANESRLGQVFLNLIVNAVHAIPEGKYEQNEVRVGTSVDPQGRVVVTIRDTGAGIPPEVRPRLFTPFFTTKPVGVGTGLGLAISHKIITSLDGTITFDSEIGKGTEFRITLPAAADDTRRQSSPRISMARIRQNLRRGRVLVIDDEDALTHTVQRYLMQTHDVVALTSSRDALDLLEAGERFDVVLCDLMMPQITGMDVHAAIARMDPVQAARVVFLSGGAFTATARAFLETSTNPRLEKPFDLRVLGDLVDDLVRKIDAGT